MLGCLGKEPLVVKGHTFERFCQDSSNLGAPAVTHSVALQRSKAGAISAANVQHRLPRVACRHCSRGQALKNNQQRVQGPALNLH